MRVTAFPPPNLPRPRRPYLHFSIGFRLLLLLLRRCLRWPPRFSSPSRASSGGWGPIPLPPIPSQPIPFLVRESKRRRTRDQLRGSAQRRRRSSWGKEGRRKEGRKEGRGSGERHRQITSRNNRPLMRVSPGEDEDEDEEDRASRMEKSPSKGRNEKHRREREKEREEALKRTQSHREGKTREPSLPTAQPNSGDATGLLLRPTLHCNEAAAAATAVSDCKWRV